MSESQNIISELLAEISRCSELLVQYREIGPSGKFGAEFINTELAKAELAISEGNIDQMVKSYSELQKLS